MLWAFIRSGVCFLFLSSLPFMPDGAKRRLSGMTAVYCIVGGSAGICTKGVWLCGTLFGEVWGFVLFLALISASFSLLAFVNIKGKAVISDVLYIMLTPTGTTAVSSAAYGIDCAMCVRRDGDDIFKAVFLSVVSLIASLISPGASPFMIIGCCAVIFKGIGGLRNESTSITGCLAGAAAACVINFLK